MGCTPPPPPPAPADAAVLPADPAVPKAPGPVLRGTPVTVDEMLSSLRLSPDGSLGSLGVF